MKSEIKNGVKVTLFVILIIVIVYFATAIFMTGELGNKSDDKNNSSDDSKTSEEVSSLYDDMIIASQTFSKSQDEYMVIFFSNKDISETLNTIMSSYSKDVKLYKVNTDEAINKYVLSEEENPNATNSSELKINKTTLITIKQKSIISYITDEDEILEKIK